MAVPFQNADSSKLSITSIGGEEVTNTETQTPPATSGEEGTQTPPATQPPATGTETGTEGGTPEGGAAAEGQEGAEGQQQPSSEAEYTEEQFHQDVDTFVSESTGGAIRSVKDIPSILEENKILKAQVAHKEPDFPNPVAKQIYDLAILATGAELSTARQLFHVMSLDLSVMTPKEKQFEAFHLDRPNLTREDALKRFDAMYEKQYNDLENDLVQTDAHEMATLTAETKLKEKMSKLQETVKQSGKTETEQGPTPEQMQAIDNQLESALSEFGGVSLKFDDSQYGKLDIPMDRSKAQEFMEILKKPYALIDRIADSCRDESGTLKVNDFVREMYLLFDRDRISQEERDHLMKLGKITQIQEQKNTPKKDLREETTTQTKPSFKDAFIGAAKAAGLAN